jgi:uncharacterized membrane protein
MPTNWLEWLGVISSILTIISFYLYLLELIKRKKHDSLMVGFLHGVKSLAVSMSKRPATTSDDWQALLQQLNDMLARLHPPSSQIPALLIIVSILWTAAAGCYFVARDASDGESVLFGVLTALCFLAAVICSFYTADCWNKEYEEKKKSAQPQQK